MPSAHFTDEELAQAINRIASKDSGRSDHPSNLRKLLQFTAITSKTLGRCGKTGVGSHPRSN